MFKLDKAPENVQEAVDQYLFLLQNTKVNNDLRKLLIETCGNRFC